MILVNDEDWKDGTCVWQIYLYWEWWITVSPLMITFGLLSSTFDVEWPLQRCLSKNLLLVGALSAVGGNEIYHKKCSQSIISEILEICLRGWGELVDRPTQLICMSTYKYKRHSRVICWVRDAFIRDLTDSAENMDRWSNRRLFVEPTLNISKIRRLCRLCWLWSWLFAMIIFDDYCYFGDY